ncbi:hypothetical protein FACS1894176_03700 [Bacteroidia bacterium]|nr:hypothetical protein FACS1894176_03700 [Bacteroidia bacterium]
MFFKEEATAMIKNIVVKILVAGIGIQASRFLVAATLDISTIMTAAVGAFPAQITATNIDLAEEFKNDKFIGRIRGDSDEIKEKLKLDLFPKGDIKDEEAQQQKTTVEEIPMSATISTGNIIDMLMPNANSFAGPLVYL